MWLVFLLSTAICMPGKVPVEIRAFDTTGLPLPGAEIREWSRQTEKRALLAITGPDGKAMVCVRRGSGNLLVSLTGFRPQQVEVSGDTAEVHLKAKGSFGIEPAEQPCVTGTAVDGSFRMCSEDVRRLPLR